MVMQGVCYTMTLKAGQSDVKWEEKLRRFMKQPRIQGHNIN